MPRRGHSIVCLRVRSIILLELVIAFMPCLEDSLDAMKTVVRKKLGLSGSTPVFLSQWREGKAVDLEDGNYSFEPLAQWHKINKFVTDEDFEAFSAATRSSTSVVVKVILGENQTQTLPLAKENEVSNLIPYIDAVILIIA